MMGCHDTPRHDTFDVSSASKRACRALLFDELDTAKTHGLDTSNASCRGASRRDIPSREWNLGLSKTLCRLAGSAISCFECHSLDGDMSACEDEFAPYNVTGHLYRRDCTVGHLDFEAFYCIKIKGIKSKSPCTSVA